MRNVTGSVVCSWLGVTVADGECDRECCVWLMGSDRECCMWLIWIVTGVLCVADGECQGVLCVADWE